jgi:hypothetical protein
MELANYAEIAILSYQLNHAKISILLANSILICCMLSSGSIRNAEESFFLDARPFFGGWA